MMSRTAWTFLLAVVTLFVGALSASAGQFERAVYYPAGRQPSQVVTGDFNNDGNTDLAFADFDQLVVLLGNGNGTFQKPLIIREPNPVALAAGDFNGDGNLDLAVIESGGSGSGALAIFLGEGNGKFHLNATYPIGAHAGVVTVADFNGDGKLDVAAGDEGDGNSGVVRIFLGTGKGTFRKPTTYNVGAWLGLMAAGDLNGDHRPDLAVTLTGSGSVAVFLNDGTGHFQKPVNYRAGDCCGPVDVKIADLRNNGDQDLVIANDNAGMVVLLNKGDGTFGKPTIYTPSFQNWQPPEACTVADFNLDGKLDVACAPAGNDAYFFYGNGKGQFGSGIEIKSAIDHQGGFSIASGDFITGDQAPDLAIPIQDDGKVAILLNTK
jgi:hypothetical protein